MMFFLFFAFIMMMDAFASSSEVPAFNFKVGTQYSYQMNGLVDSRGQTGPDSYSPGSYGTMDADVEFLCHKMYSNGTYSFILNMFDTTVNVGQDGSLAQPVSLGNDDEDNLTNKHKALGSDIYFQLYPDGTIPGVWYDPSDSPYFLQVKISAMNTLQTNLDALSESRLLESDCVGTHYSNFTVEEPTSSGLVQVNKIFDRRDVVSFADESLEPASVDMLSNSNIVMHPDGYYYSMHVEHQVSLMDVDPDDQKLGGSNDDLNERQDAFNANSIINNKDILNVKLDAATGNDTEVFATNLHSYGHITLQFGGKKIKFIKRIYGSLLFNERHC